MAKTKRSPESIAKQKATLAAMSASAFDAEVARELVLIELALVGDTLRAIRESMRKVFG